MTAPRAPLVPVAPIAPEAPPPALEIPLLRASPLCPGIVLHPAPGADDALIASARRRRLRRTPPPSPHLLCVGWRRRRPLVDPYAPCETHAPGRMSLVSSSSVSAIATLSALSPFSLPPISLSLPTLSLPRFSFDALDGFATAAAHLASTSKNILPIHAPARRRAPLALVVLLVGLVLALSMGLHASLSLGLGGLGSRLATIEHGSKPAATPGFGSGSYLAAYHYSGAYAHHARYAESRLAATHLRAVETSLPGEVGIAMPRRKSGTVDPWGLQ